MILALLLALAQAAPPHSTPPAPPMPEERARIAALAKLPLAAPTDASYTLIREGLSHAHPSVRAAAARVAHIFGGTAVLPELMTALKAETDLNPARELTWAVADLDTTQASDELLADVVARPSIGPRVLSAVVAGRGSRFLASWTRMKPYVAGYPSAVAWGLEMGLHADLGTPFVSFALRDGMDRLFESLTAGHGVRVNPGAIAAALNSTYPRIRTAAAFRLAEDGAVVEPALLSGRPAPASTEERLAMMLIEAGPAPGQTGPLPGLLAELEKDELARASIKGRLQRQRRAIRGLSPEERVTLYRSLGFEEDLVESARTMSFSRTTPSTPTAEQPPAVKTLGGYPDDFARSVFEASGCQGKEGAFEGAEISWRAGGRPARVSPFSSATSASPCGRAALILAATSLASEGDGRAVTLLPTRPPFLACLGEPDWVPDPAPSAEKAIALALGVKEPAKRRTVNPVYPEVARRNRKEGIVILEMQLRPSGCAADVRLLRGVDDALDVAAIDAVSGWAYAPTVVAGSPTAVMMTVTVNFRLN